MSVVHPARGVNRYSTSGICDIEDAGEGMGDRLHKKFSRGRLITYRGKLNFGDASRVKEAKCHLHCAHKCQRKFGAGDRRWGEF